MEGLRVGLAMWNFRFFAVVAIAAMASACASNPDLVVSDLHLSAGAVAPGAPVTIRSEVTNLGNEAVADDFGAPISATVEIGLFTRDSDPSPIKSLSSWSLPGDYPMAPGDEREAEQTILAPTGLRAGAFYVCADADPENLVNENNEDNNRRCQPLSILASPLTRADLIVENVKTLGHELASAKVSIRVKNVGDAAAAEFPIMAFSRWPRRPVMLTTCPLTEAQRVSGSAPACGGLWTRNLLQPGSSIEWIGYLTFGFGGSNFPTTPVGPQKPPIERVTIDFMADGCFAPSDQNPLPRWCRVDEIDEINNFAAKEIRVN
ncbi:MAG: CARDB domain-containing protein [Parvularculaceae bacterium]|nr:CARDB domain-containing protein [Parvularculaceae bacterium]